MNTRKKPVSGQVTIGTKPLWALMIEQELAHREQWHALRAQGWFSITDIMGKTGWDHDAAYRWCKKHSAKSQRLYNPATTRAVTLYAPAPRPEKKSTGGKL